MALVSEKSRVQGRGTFVQAAGTKAEGSRGATLSGAHPAPAGAPRAALPWGWLWPHRPGVGAAAAGASVRLRTQPRSPPGEGGLRSSPPTTVSGPCTHLWLWGAPHPLLSGCPQAPRFSGQHLSPWHWVVTALSIPPQALGSLGHRGWAPVLAPQGLRSLGKPALGPVRPSQSAVTGALRPRWSPREGAAPDLPSSQRLPLNPGLQSQLWVSTPGTQVPPF